MSLSYLKGVRQQSLPSSVALPAELVFVVVAIVVVADHILSSCGQ